MQCSRHLFLLVVFCSCCCICFSDRKADVLAFETCSPDEGINKWDLKIGMNGEGDAKTFSGIIDITDEINNDYQVEMIFTKKHEQVETIVAKVNFDNIKEPLDHIGKAWVKTRQALQPPVKEAYVIPPAKYKIDNFSVKKEELEKLPIDDAGLYSVMVKLFTPDLDEVLCVKVLADVK